MMKSAAGRKALLVVLLLAAIVTAAYRFGYFEPEGGIEPYAALEPSSPAAKVTLSRAGGASQRGTSAQADFAHMKFVDAQGEVIEGLTLTYLPELLHGLEGSARQATESVEVRWVSNPTRPVLIHHAGFEVVASVAVLQAGSLNVPMALPVSLAKVGGDRCVKGRVVDESNAPVAGALVWVKSPRDVQSFQVPLVWVRTNREGEFTIVRRHMAPGGAATTQSSAEKPVDGAYPDHGVVLGIAPNEKTGLFPVEVAVQRGVVETVMLKKPDVRTVTVMDQDGKPAEENNPNRRIYFERRKLDGGASTVMPFPGSGPVRLAEGQYRVRVGSERGQWIEVRDGDKSDMAFKLAPMVKESGTGRGAVAELEGPIAIAVRIVDKNQSLVGNASVYFKNRQGKWMPGGPVDGSGLARFTVEGYGPVTVAVAFDGTLVEDPRLMAEVKVERITRGSIQQRKDAQRYSVKLDYDATVEWTRQELAKLERITFVDSMGKAMPAGTEVIFTGKDKKEVVLKLDEKGTLKGSEVGVLYHPRLKVRHPRYGSAQVGGIVASKELATVRLPLVSEEDASDPLVITGRCVDEAGKPSFGVRVGAYPMTFAGKSAGSVAMFSLAMTQEDGTFRYRAPYRAELAKEVQGRAEAGVAFVFSGFPSDPWLQPCRVTGPLGKPVTLTLAKGDREVTLSFAGADDEPVRPEEMLMSRIDETGKTVYEVPRGWIPESGKVVLAYGSYMFKPVRGGYESLFNFDAKTPERVTVAPDSPVVLMTSVVDIKTQKGVSDALVLATDKDLTSVDVGLFTKETWEQLGKLKNPVSVKDLPAQVIEMVKPRRGAVSDELGQVRIKPGGMFKAGHQMTFVVLKEDRFPTVGRMRSPTGVSSGVVEVAPLAVPFSATLDVTFEALPGDLPPQYKGDPEMVVYGWREIEIHEVEAPVVPMDTYLRFAETIVLESRNRRICVPADTELGLMVMRSRIGLTMTEGDFASFHMPGASLLAKAGENLPVTLSRRRVIEQKFKPVGPDGKSVACSRIDYAIFGGRAWRGINTFGYDDNVFNAHVIEGMPIGLGLADIKARLAVEVFEFPAIEKASAEPILIKLSQEQVDMIANQSGNKRVK
jgi:hypothetical protein